VGEHLKRSESRSDGESRLWLIRPSPRHWS